MRKTWVVLLSLAVLVVLGSQTLANEDDFGSKIAGVWFGSVVIDLPSFPDPIPSITTYNADGTAQTSSTNPASSLHHFVWEKTGPREVTWRVLHFTFGEDEEGNSILVSISRTWGVQEYDKDFEEYTGDIMLELCPAPGLTIDQALEMLPEDPNDPDACFNPPITVTNSARRLHVSAP